jgi:hypothetical protein
VECVVRDGFGILSFSSAASRKCSEAERRAGCRMAGAGKVDPDELGDDSTKPSLQESINARLVQSGEKERLRALLRERLVECGWRDELKARCRTIIKTKGINNVTGALMLPIPYARHAHRSSVSKDAREHTHASSDDDALV